jgi:thymidylate synthase ThyX
VEPRPHADIYLVRNFPEEVTATLNGVYSRTHLSMRESFLSRLEQGLAEAGTSLDEITLPEQTPDAAAAFLTDRSGRFLKTYAIDHGHNSLREGSVLHVAVENVSQLVTRFMQRERRCSFEESSTRYISFSEEGHWRDPGVAAAGPGLAAVQERVISETFAFYREAPGKLQAHVRKVRPRAPEEQEGPYERACRSEAFDAARYLLLPALLTKFGMVIDARTLSDLVGELLAHPLAEFKIVGERLKAQADRVIRTLMTHAAPSAFRASSWERERALARELVGDVAPGAGAPDVRLLSFDPDLDVKLLASLLWESSGAPLSEVLARVAALSPARREALAEQLLSPRGPHDALPAGLEGAQPFEFECLVDFGAYRDIGRHRKGFQQMQALTTRHGFVTPPLVDEAGLGERYRAVLERAAAGADEVAQAFPHAAAYLVPFAFLQRVRILFDPRQAGYFIELRSRPEGHFSYRDVAIRMFDLIAEVAPLFARFIRVAKGRAFLGRLDTETAADERRLRRMKSAGDT